MLIVLTISSFLGGIFLVLSGRAERRSATESPVVLPTAKVEDGRALEPARPPGKPGTGMIILGVSVMLGGPVFFGFLYLLKLIGTGFNYQMGRPLRRGPRPLLPRLALGTYASDDTRVDLELGLWHRAVAGFRWLAAARHEHASVPAFEQLAHQVAMLGGASELRERCLAAAEDERRHATRCYTIARAYTSLPWRPGAMPSTSPSPAADPIAIAVDSYRDGAVGEAIAAELARAGTARAGDPAIAETLATIAGDEQRHADLAWDVIAFCIERGGNEVRAALVATAAERVAIPSPGPTGLSRGEARTVAMATATVSRERLAHLVDARRAAA